MMILILTPIIVTCPIQLFITFHQPQQLISYTIIQEGMRHIQVVEYASHMHYDLQFVFTWVCAEEYLYNTETDVLGRWGTQRVGHLECYITRPKIQILCNIAGAQTVKSDRTINLDIYFITLLNKQKSGPEIMREHLFSFVRMKLRCVIILHLKYRRVDSRQRQLRKVGKCIMERKCS